MAALRWLIVLASPGAAWLLMFAMALLGLEVLDRCCPPALMVSGLCTAPWYPAAEGGVYALSTGLAGFAFVAWPARLAPRRQATVGWAAFGLGLALALGFVTAAGSSLLVPGLAAALGGALALRRIVRSAGAQGLP
jgi:hypothetical protein